MVSSAPVPVRSYDLATIPSSISDEWHIGRRTGKAIPNYRKLADSESLDTFLANKALSNAYTVCPPEDLVRSVYHSGGAAIRHTACEVLFLSRPLIYGIFYCHLIKVLALRKWGKTDWKPWMLSLAVELTALAGSIRFKQEDNMEYADDATPVEKQEWKRRKMMLLYYLLRNPAYEIGVRGRVVGVVGFLNRWRVTSFFGGILKDYQAMWEESHFHINT
jgi:hypothetical protein